MKLFANLFRDISFPHLTHGIRKTAGPLNAVAHPTRLPNCFKRCNVQKKKKEKKMKQHCFEFHGFECCENQLWGRRNKMRLLSIRFECDVCTQRGIMIQCGVWVNEKNAHTHTHTHTWLAKAQYPISPSYLTKQLSISDDFTDGNAYRNVIGASVARCWT